jgi:hypothetical protein
MSHSIGDQMYEAAYTESLAVDQRLERLDQLGTEAAGIAIAATSDAVTPRARLLGLQGGTWLASLPSLNVVAKREQHDYNVLAEVCDNLRHLFGPIVEYEGVNFTKPPANQSSIEGYLAEMSVLGLLSWRAANTGSGNQFVLPAASWQDGRIPKNGFKRGSDLTIFEGRTIQQRLQVKRKIKALYRMQRGRPIPYYKPGIAVVSPASLTGERREHATLLLMDALVRDDRRELTWASINAEIAMEEAHEYRDEYYRTRYEAAQEACLIDKY